MAAAQSVLESGDLRELKELLVGRRIWVAVPEYTFETEERTVTLPEHIYNIRVIGVKRFLPKSGFRQKHLVQLFTDPGGERTLSVGSIQLKDPRKQKV